MRLSTALGAAGVALIAAALALLAISPGAAAPVAVTGCVGLVGWMTLAGRPPREPEPADDVPQIEDVMPNPETAAKLRASLEEWRRNIQGPR